MPETLRIRACLLQSLVNQYHVRHWLASQRTMMPRPLFVPTAHLSPLPVLSAAINSLAQTVTSLCSTMVAVFSSETSITSVGMTLPCAKFLKSQIRVFWMKR